MAYFFMIWKTHRNFWLFAILFLSLFQILILKIIATVDYSSLFATLMQFIPKELLTVFGDEMALMLTFEGAATLGFSHPMVFVILSISAIIIPSKHLAGEAESGTMELLLSFPVKRMQLLLKMYFSGLVFLFIILASALSTSLFGVYYYHTLTSDLFVKIITVVTNLWLLFIFIMSLTMLLSSFSKDGNKVAVRAAGIILIFYLLHYLTPLWNALEFTETYNFFSYYQPGELVKGNREFFLHFMVLSSLSLICLAVSLFQFKRRDIPG